MATQLSMNRRAFPILFSSLLVFIGFLNGCNRKEKVDHRHPFHYDFVENFPLAEVQQEVTLIDFGTPAAHPHLIRGWGQDEKNPDHDMTFVWSIEEKSELEFFLTAPRDIHVTFRCHPFMFPGSPTQSVSISLNGRELQTVALVPGVFNYHSFLPKHLLVPGINRLTFHYAYTRSAAEVLPGERGPVPLAVAWDSIRFDMKEKPFRSKPRANTESGALYIPFGAQVDYFLKLPEKGVLTWDDLTWRGNSEGRLKFILQYEGQKEQVLEILEASGNSRTIRLQGDNSPVVRLSFQAVSPTQFSSVLGESQWSGREFGPKNRQPKILSPGRFLPGHRPLPRTQKSRM